MNEYTPIAEELILNTSGNRQFDCIKLFFHLVLMLFAGVLIYTLYKMISTQV